MSSKMREALREAWERGQENGYNGIIWQGQHWTDIADRYGDLEFTREEARGMLEEAAAYVHYLHGAGEAVPPPPQYELEDTAEKILSRHLGETESGDKEHSLDREVGEPHGELIALTKRVAAIEKRVLADGHSSNCKRQRELYSGADVDLNTLCTCGYEELRREVEQG